MKKIVVTAPAGNAADRIREAIGQAGGGKVGAYSFCSFSTKGIGRFRPEEGATPAIGHIGELTEVEEERIEANCDDALVESVVAAIRAAHPYEEPAIDIYTLG